MLSLAMVERWFLFLFYSVDTNSLLVVEFHILQRGSGKRTKYQRIPLTKGGKSGRERPWRREVTADAWL